VSPRHPHHWRLLPNKELTREEGIEMMQVDLLFTAMAAAKEVTR